MSFKRIGYSSSGRMKVLNGAMKVVDAVSVTLGPKGRNVIISDANGVRVTKDGATVAKSIELPDRFEAMGAEFIKELCADVDAESGDGTTTAAVIAGAMLKACVPLIEAGFSTKEVSEAVLSVASSASERIKGAAVSVDSQDDIEKVATVSANGDSAIGSLLADLCSRVGDDGTVTIEEGRGAETCIEIVEGMELKSGYASPAFAGDDGEFTVIDADVLVSDDRISNVCDIAGMLSELAKRRRKLVVFSSGFSQEAVTAFAVNFRKGNLISCPVVAPGIGDDRSGTLEDIAAFCGASFISSKAGLSLRSIGLDALGKAGKITVSRSKTVISGGGGSSHDVQERVSMLRSMIQSCESDFDRERLQERLARLNGAVATVMVGGFSEQEMLEKKDRFDDALHSAVSAMENGIVAGGGLALVEAMLSLERECKETCFSAVLSALCAPFVRICENAGFNGKWVLGRIRDGEKGFSAADGNFCIMLDAGVFDSAGVVVCSLSKAASAVATLITSECFIADGGDNE